MPNTAPESAPASGAHARGRPETRQQKTLRVVAGALFNDRGEVLLAQRLAPKAYAGQWEFPGGKCELGESDRAALARELHEELGVTIDAAYPLIEIHHSYPEFRVELQVWWVSRHSASPQSKEGQPLAWAPLTDMARFPLLAADAPVVAALRLPAHYCFTPPEAEADAVLVAAERLPDASLLRLRLPQMSAAAYERLARQLCRILHPTRLLLDREPQLSASLGCGWHADGSALARLQSAPPCRGWRIASVHDRAQRDRAREAGFDAVVLSPLRAKPGHTQAAALGLDGFAALARGANVPVYALGGAQPGDMDAVRGAGGQGIAAIRGLWPQTG